MLPPLVQIPLSLYTALLHHKPLSSSAAVLLSEILTIPSPQQHDDVFRHSYTNPHPQPLQLPLQLHNHNNHNNLLHGLAPPSSSSTTASDLASLTAVAASDTLVDLSKSKADFVDSLVGVSTIIIESTWPSLAQSPQSKLVPLRRFIQEILKRSRTSFCTLQLALLYIIRLRNQLSSAATTTTTSSATSSFPSSSAFSSASSSSTPSTSSSSSPSLPSALITASPTALSSPPQPHSARPTPPVASTCGRRMFLAALIVAAKFVQDKNYSNRAWAKISGLSLAEINANEQELLRILDWDLYVGQATYVSWSSTLLARAAQVRKESSDAAAAAAAAATAAAVARDRPILDSLVGFPRGGVAMPSCAADAVAAAIGGRLSGNSVESMTPPHERADSFLVSGSHVSVTPTSLSVLSTHLALKPTISTAATLATSQQQFLVDPSISSYPSPQSDDDVLASTTRGQKRAREADDDGLPSPLSATVMSMGFALPWSEGLDDGDVQNKRIRVQ